MRRDYIVGIDIGGTKISLVLATSLGCIVEKKVLQTRVGRQARQSVREIVNLAVDLLKGRGMKPASLLGIGIGVPGPVDFERQEIEKSPNLPGWKGIPFKSIFRRKFGCPVFLENDANAAALGIKHFGEGKLVSNFIYVTVSTGIGSGIVANGCLVRGSAGAAGEIGHTTVEVSGEMCTCGNQGCLEAYASGTAMAKFARKALRQGRKSLMLSLCRNVRQVDGFIVTKAALMGDRLAIEIRERAARYLGVGLANLMDLLNPELVVLGGGVLERTGHFWKPMMVAVKRETWPIGFSSCKIVKTKLGRLVGDFGTIAVVLERISAQ